MICTQSKYHCDNCGKKLAGPSCLNIVTSKSEQSLGWARLHVAVQLISGAHNDSQTSDADLCKKCAIKLLSDALRRVRGGERATAGTEEIEEQGWT